MTTPIFPSTYKLTPFGGAIVGICPGDTQSVFVGKGFVLGLGRAFLNPHNLFRDVHIWAENLYPLMIPLGYPRYKICGPIQKTKIES
jgi:hypothetical protein